MVQPIAPAGPRLPNGLRVGAVVSYKTARLTFGVAGLDGLIVAGALVAV